MLLGSFLRPVFIFGMLLKIVWIVGMLLQPVLIFGMLLNRVVIVDMLRKPFSAVGRLLKCMCTHVCNVRLKPAQDGKGKLGEGPFQNLNENAAKTNIAIDRRSVK